MKLGVDAEWGDPEHREEEPGEDDPEEGEEGEGVALEGGVGSGGSRVRMAGQLDLRRARGRHRHGPRNTRGALLCRPLG